MIRRLLFVCIALFSLIIAKSQGLTIRGTISDQQTKAALVSATVKLSSLSDSTTARNVLTDEMIGLDKVTIPGKTTLVLELIPGVTH